MNNDFLKAGMQLINRYNNLNKKARYYGVDVLLYPSEIHVIDAIGSNTNVTTTKLASDLGITKGGISQTVSKLYEKGLVEKTEGDGINEIYIILTPKGMLAYEGHKSLHKKMNSRMETFFRKLDDHSKEEIFNLIQIIDEELSRMEEEEWFLKR